MNLPRFIPELTNRTPLRLKTGDAAIVSTSYTETDTPHHIELGPATIYLTGQEAIDVGTALIQAEHHRRALLAQYQVAGNAGEAVPA